MGGCMKGRLEERKTGKTLIRQGRKEETKIKRKKERMEEKINKLKGCI